VFFSLPLLPISNLPSRCCQDGNLRRGATFGPNGRLPTAYDRRLAAPAASPDPSHSLDSPRLRNDEPQSPIAPLPGHRSLCSSTTPAGMRSLSSASSDDDDAPPIRVPRVNQCATSRTKDSQSPAQSASKLDRRRSADRRPSFSANRRSGTGAGTGTGTGIANWRPFDSRDATVERAGSSTATTATTPPPSSSLGLMLAANGAVQEKEMVMMGKAQEHGFVGRRAPWRSPWAISVFAFVTSLLGIGLLLAVIHSSVTRQIDPKGCRMSYMRPSYAKLSDFDTEHTRLASKYSLYLYREQGIDHDVKVGDLALLAEELLELCLLTSCPGQGGARPLYSRQRRELQTSASHCCRSSQLFP